MTKKSPIPKRVALVSCVKQKRNHAAPAQDLYTSSLFQGLRKYAETHADAWFILSAEYGLLRPEQVIEPYERTLKAMPKCERRDWANRVQQQLLELLVPETEIILLAGMRYREELEPFLKHLGYKVSVPLEGLTIGRQLQRLKRDSSKSDLANNDLDRFYALMMRLASAPGQACPLREVIQTTSLPARGIYFFLEPGEFRRVYPNVSRIVRVGTHAVSVGSKSTLRKRLKQHLGTNAGAGNHRGSIFRLHVGNALLTSDHAALPTWGIGSTPPAVVRENTEIHAAEAALERRVSTQIGAMPVLWIEVPDDPGPQSDRAYIERNAIALLSNRRNSLDGASEGWLGRFSPRREIRESALWNLNYVSDTYDVAFLDKLEIYVQQTCAACR